jgi:hypothetical protein
MKFPKKHRNQTLEGKSNTYFRNYVPEDWNINEVDKDFGQDLVLDIEEEGSFRGLELIVQLKSSEESNRTNDSERNVFSIANYNYLWNNLRVVLLVKYVASEDEAYWLLLKDVPTPDFNNDNFTVHFPLTNKLSEINWGSIVEYVRNVHNKKIQANRG